MSDLARAGWDCHVHVFDASSAARAGHYRPADRPLAQIEATAQGHGIGHLVLVQPSVYGTDNTLLLRALANEPRRHRGVVVVADDVSDAELDAMHDRGVRGARLNLVSPVGETAEPARRFHALAPRLQRLGWHVQWYAKAEQLILIAELHRASDVTCVLDHLAGLDAEVADDHPAWHAAQSLAERGAWLKLSGWYRLGARAPYTELVPRIRRLAPLFSDRMVWGSDWPHTTFAPDAVPSYRETWDPVVAALGLRAAEALRSRRPPIYS